MPGQSSALADRLGELLRLEKFPPPACFAARAGVADPHVYEQAAADPVAWWAAQARERLHWDTPFRSVLDDGHPPFYTWFADGTINVSYNCLDRYGPRTYVSGDWARRDADGYFWITGTARGSRTGRAARARPRLNRQIKEAT